MIAPPTSAAPAAPAMPRAGWPWPEGRARAVGVGTLGGGSWVRRDGVVDSVQWVDLPGWRPDLDLAAAERAYFAWVPHLTGEMTWPEPANVGRPSPLAIHATPWGFPVMIQMAAPTLAPGRRARAIEGGLAALAGGELAFEVLELEPDATRLVVALTGFRPRAPLPIYLRTQRVMHERSTFGFLRQVARAWRAVPGRP